MKLKLYQRDFTDLIVPPDLEFTIERYGWSDMGGPKTATIQASGDLAALFELVNHLRAPVEIINDLGEAVWWGYLAELQINTGEINFGVDLETMFNDVAVAYTDQNVRFTTQWSGDADSIAEYGQKEILLSKSDVTEADALQHRDTFLANAKHPIPTLQFSSGQDSTATLTCKGWIKTLEWLYYANATGKESYEISGTGGREIGEDDRPWLAQSFMIASAIAWDASSIWLRPWKQGVEGALPTDNLIVSIKEDFAGIPGITLASGQLSAADIGTSSEWLEFVLTPKVTLQPATAYWIQVTRSGSVAESNYFMVDTNVNAGYPRGHLYLWNTPSNSWGEDIWGSFWGDLLFILVGNTETSNQITSLVSVCGQFLNGTIIEDESGLESNPYRDGESVGLYELEKLLNTGTINSRRLLCEVTRNRYLRVYEEPAKPTTARSSYALNKNGQLTMENLTEIDQSLCPVGVWCHLQDVIPASVDLSMVADPSLFLIEEAEFDVAEGKYNVVATRDQGDAMDIGGVIQG